MMPMRRHHIALLALLGVAGCNSSSGSASSNCPLACETCSLVMLQLTCTADVVSAELTGPCAPVGDAGSVFVGPADAGGQGIPACAAGLGFTCAPLTHVPFSQCDRVFFSATAAGTCHVGLTFSDGFKYTADVEFREQPQGCGCPSVLSPSTGTLTVGNPGSTCTSPDAG